MSAIEWVDDLSADAIDRAGPKIAKLGELRRLSMPVPRGFVVTTAAYLDAMADPSIRAKITTALEDVDVEDHPGVQEIAKSVRDFLEKQPMPDSLERDIVAAYEQLGEQCGDPNVATAVRSSATGEDATDASFAGQFDTYLGVRGASDLVASVRSCWASLFTDRAVTYRAMNNVDYADCPMAVGVLELIDAKASGVAFSAHPVTGKTDRIVIEGSWGWGEAVVQGLVTPDRAEVGKSDGRLLDYVVSNKLIMSDFDSDSGRVVEGPMPEDLRMAQVLNDAEIAGIVDAVRQIEQHFDHVVDVEWVTSHSQNGDAVITIVQARPETVHGPAGEVETPKWDPAGYALQYGFGKSDS